MIFVVSRRWAGVKNSTRRRGAVVKEAQFDARGSRVRWTEVNGSGPARVYVHGLGAASTVYHAHIAARAELAGRRSLFLDLPGHGLSDRPADFSYSLEGHADAVAAALDEAQVDGAEIIAHSMGGSVAIVLADRRPDLVTRLVLTEANLDPHPPATAGSSGIATYTEEDFLAGGYARVLEKVGPTWAATMRLTDPLALHRSATGLVAGTRPTLRHMLMELPVDRVYLQGDASGELAGRDGLTAAGVRVVTVPGAGHNVMFDNADAFVAAIAGRRTDRICGSPSGTGSVLAYGQSEETGILVDVRGHEPAGTCEQRSQVGLRPKIGRSELPPLTCRERRPADGVEECQEPSGADDPPQLPEVRGGVREMRDQAGAEHGIE